MKKIYRIFLILFFYTSLLYGQSYQSLRIKEEFDLFNSLIINNSYQPCNISPNNDVEVFGDGMSKILDGYITMYKATLDKAYMYKFVIQSLCMMKNRHDFANISNEPRWGCGNCCANGISDCMYLDGYIIGAMSRFVYFVRIEEPSLQNVSLYQFSEIVNIASNSPFYQTFSTFGQYANWLGYRVDETLDWFLANGYWNDNLGFTNSPNAVVGAEINKQIGFARALLFMGLSDPNTSVYQPKAINLANKMKGNIYFYDSCEDMFYNAPVFYTTNNNAYWWYHSGWSIPVRNCSVWVWVPPHYIYYNNEPDYLGYTYYFEDISHGSIDTWFPLDCYYFQPNTPFASNDMIRLRNMFTKNIFDQNGGFNEAVNGQNYPVYPSGQLDFSALNYMPFKSFDGADTSASMPNVYGIIMDFYSSFIAGHNSLPSMPYYNGGHSNKGHAEVVQAQWENECVDLTLYNRDVVYDQDFIVKGNLVIDPSAGVDNSSYAEPIITDPVFIIESGATVNMTAGESIELRPPGFEAKAGSAFSASIDPNLCSSVYKKANPNNSNILKSFNTNEKENISLDSNKVKQTYMFENTLSISPNPFSIFTNIQFTLQKSSFVTLKILDNFGRIMYDQIRNRKLNEGIYNIPISGDNFASGVYYCILIIDNKILKNISIVKK